MDYIYRLSCFCFETSIYLWLLACYADYEGILPNIFIIILIISFFLSAFPSGYYRRGYNINYKKVEIVGFLKFIQMFVFFVITPKIGVEKIIIPTVILIILSIVKLYNQRELAKQISSENITLNNLIDKMTNQSEKEKEYDELLSAAWKIIIPFFFVGLIENDAIVVNLLIYIVVFVLEFYMIVKFYKKLMGYHFNSVVRLDFIKTLSRVFIAFTLLILISIIDANNFFVYAIMGYCPAQFVDLVHRTKNDSSKQIN